MILNDFLEQQIAAHAEQEYPRESCGFILGDDEYVPMENIADEPLTNYKIDVVEYLTYSHMGLRAIIHSHPDGPEYPTKADMESQVRTAVPAGIVPVKVYKGATETVLKAGKTILFGDGTVIPPILGRPFRHGVTDCYSLIRDWYKLNFNVVLPVYPREWGWWETGENMYEDYFTGAGCRDLEPGEDPQHGDIFLATIRSKGICNHAGILLETGQIVHHLAGSLMNGYDPTALSTRDSGTRWANSIFFKKWVRHESQ